MGPRRDQIYTPRLVALFVEFLKQSQDGHGFNVGGGRKISVSITEAIDSPAAMGSASTATKAHAGTDRICCISELGRVQGTFPQWDTIRSIANHVRDCRRGPEDSDSAPGCRGSGR